MADKVMVRLDKLEEHPKIRAIVLGMGLDADLYVAVSTTVRALIENPLEDEWRVDLEGTKWAMQISEGFFFEPSFRVCVMIEAAMWELTEPGRSVAAAIDLIVVRPAGEDEGESFLGDATFFVKAIAPGTDWRTIPKENESGVLT
jgi:hypothetical protein